MISGSISKVEAGTKIADETAVALNKIVEDVTKAAELVSDIAVASNEQAIGIGQVNQALCKYHKWFRQILPHQKNGCSGQ